MTYYIEFLTEGGYWVPWSENVHVFRPVQFATLKAAEVKLNRMRAMGDWRGLRVAGLWRDPTERACLLIAGFPCRYDQDGGAK